MSKAESDILQLLRVIKSELNESRKRLQLEQLDHATWKRLLEQFGWNFTQLREHIKSNLDISWSAIVRGWLPARNLRYVFYSDTDSSFITLYTFVIKAVHKYIDHLSSASQNKQLKQLIESAQPYFDQIIEQGITRLEDKFLSVIALQRDELLNLLETIINELVDPTINEFLLPEYTELSAPYNQDYRMLSFKQEMIAKSVYMYAKKNYLLWLLREKGRAEEAIIKQGGSFKGSDRPLFIRTRLDDLAKLILNAEPARKIIDYLRTMTREYVKLCEQFHFEAGSPVKIGTPEAYERNTTLARSAIIYESITSQQVFSTALFKIGALQFYVRPKAELVQQLKLNWQLIYKYHVAQHRNRDYQLARKLRAEHPQLHLVFNLWDHLIDVIETMIEYWRATLPQQLLEYDKQITATLDLSKKSNIVNVLLSYFNTIAIPEEQIDNASIKHQIAQLLEVDPIAMITSNMSLLFNLVKPLIQRQICKPILEVKKDILYLFFVDRELVDRYAPQADKKRYYQCFRLDQSAQTAKSRAKSQSTRTNRIRSIQKKLF